MGVDVTAGDGGTLKAQCMFCCSNCCGGTLRSGCLGCIGAAGCSHGALCRALISGGGLGCQG
eukprot:9420997-Ditylum_brightwellii.AAC.1